MNIVLFSKDLRISDHQPLTEAAAKGTILPLYIIEPSLWEESALSARHFKFVAESLEDLSKQIEDRGGKLFFAIDELETVLGNLLVSYDSINLYAHNDNRLIDKAALWMEQHHQRLFTFGPELESVPVKLYKNRLQSYLNEPIENIPNRIEVPEQSPAFLFTDLKKLQKFSVKGSKIRFGQQGGEGRAIETLDSFLEERFANYIANQHKPLPSSLSSSRLSAYITWGNISVRTIFQKTNEKFQFCEVKEEQLQLEEFLSKLTARLKIFSIPHEDLSVTDVGMIKREWNEEWFQRWLQGSTGIPMIDAAMRSLFKTGWLNFTLRGLVISFITNTLLLDGHKPSRALAELFLDYEPGVHDFYIHQLTGMAGKVKITDPVKIGKQLDPDGVFIRRYIPELNSIPGEYIHEPWLYPAFYRLGYTAPIVDVKKANKHARIQFQGIKGKGKRGREKGVRGTEQLSFDL